MKAWQTAAALILALLIGYAAGQVVPLRNSSPSHSSSVSTILSNSSTIIASTSSITSTSSTSSVNTNVGGIPVMLTTYNLSSRDSLELGGYILTNTVGGATVNLLNLTTRNSGADEVTSIQYGIQNFATASGSKPLAPSSTETFQLTMVEQGDTICSGDLPCLMGIKPSYNNEPSPGVETINEWVNVTYSDGENYSVPVPVPILPAGGHYAYGNSASFVAGSVAFPSLERANSTDCASLVSGLRFSNSSLGNSGQSTNFGTNVIAPNRVLGILGFYLEDPLNPSAIPTQTSQNTFTEIHPYGGALLGSWLGLNVVSGKTYTVVLQIGFATYLRTLTESTATSTRYVPVGVVFSSAGYCSVSITLQAS